MTGTPADERGRSPRLSPEQRSALATVGAVVAIVLVVLVANIVARVGGNAEQADPVAASTSPSAQPLTRAQVDAMTPEEIAADALQDRGQVVLQPVPAGGKKLAGRAERLASDQPYDFTLTSFNVLGSQHTAPGGSAQEFAPGRIRAEWTVGLVGAYGSSIVGMQELQADQLDAIDRATAGTFEFWPGTALGGKGIPQSLMWKSSVWTATYTDSITIPFMDTTRPQPIVRLQHVGTGREIYVMNVHNSPKDAQGREDERDKATAIEIAAIKQLRRQDGIPVFVMGDFNEHAEVFCKITGQTDLEAAQGGSNDGTCRPPSAMRVDWIFGSSDVDFSGFRMDTSAQVRRITDHAVLTSSVSVP